MNDQEQDIIIYSRLRASKLCSADQKPALFPSRCSSAKIKTAVFGLFPVLSWLPKYKIKDYIIPDLLGGISGGSIQVPQGEGIPSAKPISLPTPLSVTSITQPCPWMFTVSVFCRHGICSAGQPSCCQRPLLLLLPPPDLLLPGRYPPDGAR